MWSRNLTKEFYIEIFSSTPPSPSEQGQYYLKGEEEDVEAVADAKDAEESV